MNGKWKIIAALVCAAAALMAYRQANNSQGGDPPAEVVKGEKPVEPGQQDVADQPAIKEAFLLLKNAELEPQDRLIYNRLLELKLVWGNSEWSKKNIVAALANLTTRDRIEFGRGLFRQPSPVRLALTMMHEADHVLNGKHSFKAGDNNARDLRLWFTEEMRTHSADDRRALALEKHLRKPGSITNPEQALKDLGKAQRENGVAKHHYEQRLAHLDVLETLAAQWNFYAENEARLEVRVFTSFKTCISIGDSLLQQMDMDTWARMNSDVIVLARTARSLEMHIPANRRQAFVAATERLEQTAGQFLTVYRLYVTNDLR